MSYRYGRRAPKNAPALRLSNLLTGTIPAIVSAWTAKPHWFKGATAAAKVLKAHGL